MSVGENIKKARKAAHMSQDELADAIGANRVTISKYENDVYAPSVDGLLRLTKALKITIAELTGEIPLSDEEKNDTETPKTYEARLISGAIDKMPKEQRERALDIMRVVFAEYAAEFDKEGNETDET